ncbi:MAG TPA: methyltransferase, partial [Halobacteriales archaeon]|nr:methyltransferase [Halobacteriales archaeon]
MEKKFYKPAEDSALLANCAMESVGEMDCVLDIGTGSGY